ncbi:30S ribosome-binding factor RbfA [bacterium]|nr:30S ribosome-binding factor RbfA [bacterium]
MAQPRRIQRINSLLKEVISDVVRLELKHYHLPELLTITNVEASKDLQYAKVFVSLINGSEEEKTFMIEELQKCSASIAKMARKKVVMRYFPILTFKIDNTLDEYMKINDLLEGVKKEKIEETEEETEEDNG